MKIELLFCKRSNGFDCYETISLGKFPSKKAAYSYAKSKRKFFSDGFFALHIYEHSVDYYEQVYNQDLLNV